MSRNISVRVASATIHNFKNVVNGFLSFENPRKNYKASILGLYGQNGSGKTALIDSFEILKHALSGTRIPPKFADYINVDADRSTFVFDFLVRDDQNEFRMSYQFSVKSVNIAPEGNNEPTFPTTTSPQVQIIDEIIKCPVLSDRKTKTFKIIDTSSGPLFGPDTKRELFVGNDKDMVNNLVVAKAICLFQSRSFAFSYELLSKIRETVEKDKDNTDLDYYFRLLESLVVFGNYNLFVINTSNSGFISFNTQPLVFHYPKENSDLSGTMMLSLDKPNVIPKEVEGIVISVINDINEVLDKVIPGLTIGVVNLGNLILKEGKAGCSIQLVSKRKGKVIPLNCESEGIKKIISILHLLIVMYSQQSITIAVDELDSGVFEYLLGELLRIISEKGNGQLIFTSHNLRPLETLDRGFVAFTTTDPDKRYSRLTGIKNNNNLRDFYFRDIMLGTQSDKLYETTNNSEIALALHEAGAHYGV